MKHIILPLILFSCLSLRAQYTDGSVEVSSNDSEIEIVELKDSTLLCALPLEDGFMDVTALLWVKAEDFSDGFIAKGSSFFNDELEECGRALEDLEDIADTTFSKRKYRDFHRVEIKGRLHNTRVIENTVPEDEYGRILRVKSRFEQDERLEVMLENLDFKKKEEGDYTYWVKRQTNCSLAFEEGKEPFRMIIVLRGGRPYCVVTNGTEFSAPKLKETKIEEPYHFYYFQKAREDVHNAIKDVMYSYVPL
jgi:hypothetical protein